MIMQQHLSVQNTTRAATDWAASPVGQLVRVEVLVTLSCALLTMLVFLGSGRRYCRSAAFRAVVWLALTLSYPVVSYTIGLMQSAAFHNDLMVVWACFLLGCADGIAACSVDDSDQQARLLLNQAAQTIYVFLLLLSYAGSLRLELKILVFLFWVLTAARLGLRLQRALSVSRGRVLTVDNGLITKYMQGEYDPSNPERCKYVVTGEENQRGEYRLMVTNDIVTLDRVIEWRGRHLEGSELESNRELMTLCWSFAFFKLLRRRLTRSPHYELHPKVIHKVRRLFYYLLLADKDRLGPGYNMYRVIETELGFLFDFFYSRYPSHKQSLIPETILFTLAIALTMTSLFSSTLMHYSASDSVIVATWFDIWLARLVIFMFLVLEAFQYLSLVLSDWHRVKLFCRYVITQEHSLQNNSILASLILRVCRLKMTKRYWSNTLGQYSLLHACIQPENSCFSRQWLPEWIMRSFLVRTSTTTHRDLPVSVKDAIAYELENGLRHTIIIEGRYGTFANYHPGRPSWGACELCSIPPMLNPTIHNILVWHIATTICDTRKVRADDPVVREERLKTKEIASTLSAYCAYLICHAPELITNNIYEAQLLLEGVRRRVRQYLQDCRCEDNMYTKLASSLKPNAEDEYDTIVAQGVRLSEILITHEHLDEWGLLAELWVKFLLSNVASSNNMAAHVKRLASGGEFITHLWAFMTQGGFVREPWILFGDGMAEDTQRQLEAGRLQDRRIESDTEVWIKCWKMLPPNNKMRTMDDIGEGPSGIELLRRGLGSTPQ